MIEIMVNIKESYGKHPCGSRFCKKCNYPMLPPAYRGDYWDCTNSECRNSVPPTKMDLKRMIPNLKRIK
jgi:hypothetical protein